MKNPFPLGEVCNSISWVFSVQTHGKSHCLFTSDMISYETGSGWTKEMEKWLYTGELRGPSSNVHSQDCPFNSNKASYLKMDCVAATSLNHLLEG